MKKIRILALLVLAVLLLAGCEGRRLQDVRVTSARLVQVTPEGLTSLSALVELGVHNPSVTFEVSALEGLARFKGQDVLTLHSEPFSVAARSDELYSIPLRGRIVDGFNPLQLIRLLGDGLDRDDVTVSLRGRVTLRSGVGKNIELEDIPLRVLLEQIEQEKDETEQ
ncbi:MAG: hypothetical protein IJV37_02640 [Bacteroidales bacterium]|nr:hypothetical protein [Bacteroidales bacterium]